LARRCRQQLEDESGEFQQELVGLKRKLVSACQRGSFVQLTIGNHITPPDFSR
jgi:hypothetical protein